LLKLGLVIQGPILSIGRTGKGIDFDPNRISQGEFAEYDCTADIVANFKNYQDKFHSIVLSTWDSEIISDELQECEGLDLVVINESESIRKFNFDYSSSANLEKQFFSTLVGLNSLEKSGCNAAIKIRTDQVLDLNEMLENQNIFLQKKLFVPFRLSDIPDYMHDFYFAGGIELLQKFCHNITGSKPHFSNVHRDLFYRFMDLTYPRIFRLFYFPKGSDFSRLQQKRIERMWSTHLGILPASVWNSIIWRGSKIPVRNSISTKGMIFEGFEPHQNISSNFHRLPSFDFFAISRYFLGVSFTSLIFKAIAFLGKFRVSKR
jgi:hypothetical protein